MTTRTGQHPPAPADSVAGEGQKSRTKEAQP
jgi:hypothetical protein